MELVFPSLAVFRFASNIRSATGVAEGSGMRGAFAVAVSVTFGGTVVAGDLDVVVGVVTDGLGVVVDVVFNVDLVVVE